MRTVQLFYSPAHAVHNPSYELYDGNKVPYAECADRLTVIADHLRQAGRCLHNPKAYSVSHITALHSRSYVNYVHKTSVNLQNDETRIPSNFIMDTYTPITSGTYTAARQAVSTVLSATDSVLNHGDTTISYALCRPPGHHAAQKHSGGYCYFNNAAIAAHFLSKHGRVAILDIDYHHGNGTQELFYDRNDVLYVSLHADPRSQFPYNSGYSDEMGSGAGHGYTCNYPMPLHTRDTRYLRTLTSAIANITTFNPDFLIISAGFDAHIEDPICQFSLTTECYRHIGTQITNINIPTVIIQEGGYNLSTLGPITETFISGLETTER